MAFENLFIHFWMKSRDLQSTKPKNIYCRITYEGKRKDWSTGIKINPKHWIKTKTKISMKASSYLTKNKQLEQIKDDIKTAFFALQEGDIELSVNAIHNQYAGIQNYLSTRSLIEAFNYYILRMTDKAKMGKFSHNTVRRYKITKAKVVSFLDVVYYKTDFPLDNLKMRFILDFEHYLITHDKISVNTAHKYIKNVKRIIHYSMAMNWIEIDPFRAFKCTYTHPKREVLTQDEIDALINLQTPNLTLAAVRDVFLFSCYTGFAYSEVAALTPEHVHKGFDGNLWISIYRAKTGSKENLPILPPALEIIEKYKDHYCRTQNGKLLYVLQNHKYNKLLKTLAQFCGITKNLTTHTARHTFATTITLSNGVPIETVSKMLGHQSIKTTQIYAKVVEQKISDDMILLKEKLFPAKTDSDSNSKNKVS